MKKRTGNIAAGYRSYTGAFRPKQPIPKPGQADAKRSRSPRRSSRSPPWLQAGNPVRGLRWRGHRLPPRNDPHALPPSDVVGDEREMPAQLDDGGQLPVFVEHTADRRGGLFVHTEHRSTMRRRAGTGKRNAADPPSWLGRVRFSNAAKRWRHLAVPPGLGKPCSPELHGVNLRLHR